MFDYNIRNAIADCAATCIEHEINLVLSNQRHVIYAHDSTQTPCSGYFTANKVLNSYELAVATGKPLEEWLPVLLHESSHMDQYLEMDQAWVNCTMPDGSDSSDALFEWIGGREYSEDEIKDIAMRSLYVELDCEKRTLDKVRQYELEYFINPATYVMKANSYIYFYLFVLETREFYTRGYEPYNVEDVWKYAPGGFDNDYTKIPPALRIAFEKHMRD